MKYGARCSSCQQFMDSDSETELLRIMDEHICVVSTETLLEMSFPRTVTEWRNTSFAIAQSKGWHDDEGPRPQTEKLGLIHSEVSEAFEEVRMPDFDPHRVTFTPEGKPEGYGIELADIIIRVLDLAGMDGVDIESAMQKKTAFNRTRPHKHGGKRC